MTKKNSHGVVKSDFIVVKRDTRQRRKLEDIESLMHSIANVGLINNPVITRSGTLIAGERRLTAMRNLGWTDIPVHFLEDLGSNELQLIELEENIKRVDLPWQDQVSAFKRMHELLGAEQKDWNVAKTSAQIGVTDRTGRNWLSIANEIAEGNTAVIEAPKISVAKSIVERKNNREGNEETSEIADLISSIVAPAALQLPPERVVIPAPMVEGEVPLINADFTEWAKTYTGAHFNFIHCDFPYGVGMQDSDQSARKNFGSYEDGIDVYWALIAALADNMNTIIAPDAHLMFWFSMDFYTETKAALEQMGWIVSPFPLVWHKTDNKGIAPDAKRQPRRIYETAFHCIRGDRFIAKMKANTVGSSNIKVMHMSEKPVAMLDHFMEMYIDSTTLMLDPTCGSGNAVLSALKAGAKDALGIEKSPEFYAAAVDAWKGRES